MKIGQNRWIVQKPSMIEKFYKSKFCCIPVLLSPIMVRKNNKLFLASDKRMA